MNSSYIFWKQYQIQPFLGCLEAIQKTTLPELIGGNTKYNLRQPGLLGGNTKYNPSQVVWRQYQIQPFLGCLEVIQDTIQPWFFGGNTRYNCSWVVWRQYQIQLFQGCLEAIQMTAVPVLFNFQEPHQFFFSHNNPCIFCLDY